MAHEQEKEGAAQASLKFVKDGQIVGLGTGSTAAFLIQLLSEKVKKGLHIQAIPTSDRSGELAASLGIPLTTLDEHPEIDVTIDGADEVDEQLRLTKGGGGALLREKIVGSATKQYVIIADSSKRVPVLGKFPLPVEVIKFAQAVVERKIRALGASVDLRRDAKGNPFLTDEHNHILDCRFGEIRNPEALARSLSDIPGIVEHGLFIGMANVVLIANGSQIIELTRKR
jgi:ribose 5-phosphate isomerase A